MGQNIDLGKAVKKKSGILIKRRTFLEGMTALGVVTATAPLFSCSSDGPGEQEEQVSAPQTETVYRFQTRKARTCKSCKLHGRYKLFLTEAAADQNRSHPGCNCRIVTQEISEAYSEQIAPFEVNGVIDLRKVNA